MASSMYANQVVSPSHASESKNIFLQAFIKIKELTPGKHPNQRVGLGASANLSSPLVGS